MATTPLAIVFGFVPLARQIVDPVELAHVTVFPAAVRAGPEEMLPMVNSEGEYARVHCNPAVPAVAGVHLRSSETVAPAEPCDEDNCSDPCPKLLKENRIAANTRRVFQFGTVIRVIEKNARHLRKCVEHFRA